MKLEAQKQARELRSQGLSIPKIAKTLGVARGSVSIWVRDIVLTEVQQNILKTNRSSFKERVDYNKEKQIVATSIREGQFRAGKDRAAIDSSFRLICGLYWGEGYKTNNKNTFSIANSDEYMIRLLVRWLIKEGYSEKLRLLIATHRLNSRTDLEIVDFWSNFVQLPVSCFLSVVRAKYNRASQYKNVGKLPNGTVTVYVHDTELLQSVLGGIDYLKKEYDPVSDIGSTSSHSVTG